MIAMDISALVVDDSGIMRKMVMKSLGEPAWRTSVHMPGRCRGPQAVQAQQIDMIFVDWNMRG